MAISITSLTSGASTTNTTTYTTASISPASGQVIVAWFGASGIATDIANTCSGLGGTWVTQGHLYPAAGLTNRQLTLFTCTNYSGSGTLTFGNTDSCTNGVWSVFLVSGANTTTPIVAGSFVTNTSGASNVSTLSVTLNSPADSNNRPIAFYCGDNNTTNFISPRTNWTEIHDFGTINPSLAADTQWRSDAFETTASGTWTDGVTYFTAIMAAEVAAASTGTNVNAECPSVAFASNDGDAAVAPNAGNATVTLTANNTVSSVKVNAQNPVVALTANPPSSSIRANAGVATVAIVVSNPTAKVSPNSSNGAVSFVANNATVTTGHFTDVFPDTPVVSVTSNNVTKSVSVNAGVATVAFVANNVTANIASTATFAALAFTANNNTPRVSVNAGLASITLTANKPGSGRTPNAPTTAFAAGDVDEKISVNAGASSVTVVANDSTVSTSGNTNAQAGNASVTVTANQPGKSVSVNAGLASLVMAAQQAAPASRVGAGVAGITVGSLTPTAAVLAAAGIASVGWTANNTTTKVSPTSDYSTVQIGALSATVPAQFLGPPDLIIKKLSTSTTVNDKSNSVTCSAKTEVLTVTDLTNGLIIRKVDNTVTVN